MNNKTIYILILSIFLNTQVFADKNTITNNTNVNDENLTNNIIKDTAKTWSLNTNEYLKSQKLKNNFKGMLSNDLSPLEYLGIFAENDAERRKYAKLFMELDRKIVKQILAFDKIIQEEKIKKYGRESLFINSPKKQSKPQRNRFTLDIKTCDNSCIQYTKQLVTKAIIYPLDLYFIDAENSEIQEFAIKVGITVDEVNRKIITLNHQ